MGDIPSDSELLFHIFPVFRVSRAGQILFLEFIKDGSADLGNNITYRGLANPSVILQGHVCFSCCQVSKCFDSTSKGFIKLLTDFLMWCMHSLMT